MQRRQLGWALAALWLSQMEARAQGLTGGLGLLKGALPNGLSQTDAVAGLRQALTQGAGAAVLRVAKLDGYWADGMIRIPLPKAMAQAQRSLKPLGLSGPLDDVQLKLNRAAEAAAPKARDLFNKSIQSLTIEDVNGVLRGGPTAATDLLRSKTAQPLALAFKPPMIKAMGDTGAIKALDKAISNPSLRSVVGDAPSDTLASFGTERALDGLFHYVALEEMAIRANPVKRTTSLLKKVFGGL